MSWHTKYCRAQTYANWRMGVVQRKQLINDQKKSRILSVKLKRHLLITLAEVPTPPITTILLLQRTNYKSRTTRSVYTSTPLPRASNSCPRGTLGTPSTTRSSVWMSCPTSTFWRLPCADRKPRAVSVTLSINVDLLYDLANACFTISMSRATIQYKCSKEGTTRGLCPTR